MSDDYAFLYSFSDDAYRHSVHVRRGRFPKPGTVSTASISGSVTQDVINKAKQDGEASFYTNGWPCLLTSVARAA